MERSLYYDIEGNPITAKEWSVLHAGSVRFLARTDLPGGVWISTVHTGLDMSLTDRGRPIIFETMVFGPAGVSSDLDCERYCTKEEALAGHEAMVTKWTGWTPGDPDPGTEEEA